MQYALGYAMALATGLSLGLLGSGGSLLAVPALVYFFGLDAVTATSYSLFIVGAVSLFGFSAKARDEALEWLPTLAFAAPSVVAVFGIRKYLVHSLPTAFVFPWGSYQRDTVILVMFAMVMLAAGLSMLRKSKPVTAAVSPRGHTLSKPGFFLLGAEGLAVGGITGLAGAGGGFLIVPAMTLLGGIPFKTAVMTSLMIISVQSLVGFTGDFAAGETIRWGFLLRFTLLSLAGVALGHAASGYWAGERLKQAYGWFTLFVSLAVLAREFFPGGKS